MAQIKNERCRGRGGAAITAVHQPLLCRWALCTGKHSPKAVTVDRIREFYAIEDKARFAPPAERLAHRAATIPLLDAFFTWAQATERRLSARSELAEAFPTSSSAAPR